MGSFATTASILVAMSGWTVALVGPGSWARLAWTFGLAAFLIHVGFAFGFFYAWSHETALAETARQTEEVVGVESSVGLWVNYAFTAILALDVLQQWRSGTRRFATAIDWLVIFMIVNGAVVFADGFVRLYGLVIIAFILTFRLKRARRGPLDRAPRQ